MNDSVNFLSMRIFSTWSQLEYSNFICSEHFTYTLIVVINADSIYLFFHYLSIRNLQKSINDKTFKFSQ